LAGEISLNRQGQQRTASMASPHRNQDVDTIRASAQLPGLNIDIVHSQSPDGDSEQISITLQAVSSFEAFGRALEAANPFVFWTQAMRLAWLPWLEAARIAMLPPNLPAPRKAVPPPSDERD
jgi:hypothetical protein